MRSNAGWCAVTLVMLFMMLVLTGCGAPWYVNYGISSRVELTQPSSVPNLIQALKSKDAGVRASAALVLAKIGPSAKEAVPVLTELLDPSQRGVRISAAKAIGKIGYIDDNAVFALVKAFDDRSWQLRAEAVQALYLNSCTHPEYVRALKMLSLTERVRPVRRLVSLALRSL